jgi:hypothetical protein
MLLLAGELGVRQTQWRFLLNEELPEFPSRYFREQPSLGTDLSVNHSEQRLKMRAPAHRVHTNRFGCYDFNRNAGGGYILLVGGDLAWGYVPILNHWGTTVETELGRRVIKCGMPGTGTATHLQKAKQVIGEIGDPPSLIILLYENNDFIDDVVAPNFMMVNDTRVERFRWMDLETGYVERHTQETYEEEQENKEIKFRKMNVAQRYLSQKSALYSAVAYFFHQEKSKRESSENRIRRLDERDLLQVSDNTGWLDNELNSHLENLKGFKTLADWHSSNLLVLTSELYPQHRGAKVQEWFDNHVQNNFDVGQAVKAREKRQKKSGHLYFYPYWNRRGNQMAAFEILDYIKTNGILK